MLVYKKRLERVLSYPTILLKSSRLNLTPRRPTQRHHPYPAFAVRALTVETTINSRTALFHAIVKELQKQELSIPHGLKSTNNVASGEHWRKGKVENASSMAHPTRGIPLADAAGTAAGLKTKHPLMVSQMTANPQKSFYLTFRASSQDCPGMAVRALRFRKPTQQTTIAANVNSRFTFKCRNSKPN